MRGREGGSRPLTLYILVTSSASWWVSFVEDRRQRPGQQGLPAAWGAAHQDVVSPRRGHLQGPLGVLLAPDVGQVDDAGVPGSPALPAVGGLVDGIPCAGVYGNDTGLMPQMGHQLREVVDRHYYQSLHQRRLMGVRRRDEDCVVPLLPGYHNHGEDAVGMPQAAVQRQLSQEE